MESEYIREKQGHSKDVLASAVPGQGKELSSPWYGLDAFID
jgi:hypothetical protein